MDPDRTLLHCTWKVLPDTAGLGADSQFPAGRGRPPPRGLSLAIATTSATFLPHCDSNAQRLDDGAPGATIAANSEVATVGALNGSKDLGG